ncbi:biotin--[acetyl-CoA-carboxylase] ligase [Blattabacterium cuenoti]|uniref:biotin--[acetyl-CoA-carboxylase] ligase n=1 Tax=Blattabacterium cuenoti TaxID=1653831 RepID=UPI00163BAB76|nr:biotin--[acetyl-CoA-carboxylase] ligase [Blattabacterium cuenoti]
MKKFIWPIDFIFLKKINSTNQYATQYANKYILNKKNWIVIWTMNQTKGKGSEKNFWYSEKNKGLTFSIIFKPIKNFPIEKKYIINVIISNAVHKTLSKYQKKKFWIKWPNDIISNNKKIGGILIENSISIKKIHTSIIGIGLNIYPIKLDHAISLEEILKNINLKLFHIFHNLVFSIQEEYFFFLTFGENYIRKYYINNLYLKDITSYFYIYRISKSVKGIIRSINEEGFLIIELTDNQKFHFFSQKEIKFLIP